jgi:hypothetical protein
MQCNGCIKRERERERERKRVREKEVMQGLMRRRQEYYIGAIAAAVMQSVGVGVLLHPLYIDPRAAAPKGSGGG